MAWAALLDTEATLPKLNESIAKSMAQHDREI